MLSLKGFPSKYNGISNHKYLGPVGKTLFHEVRDLERALPSNLYANSFPLCYPKPVSKIDIIIIQMIVK